MREMDLQAAVYALLVADASLMGLAAAVYDHVPQNAVFPYVVIGEDAAAADDTDDTASADHVITIHTWAAYRGLKQVKQLQQYIYAALHRTTLTVNGVTGATECSVESSDNFLDSDGLTRHGVQRVRVLIDGV